MQGQVCEAEFNFQGKLNHHDCSLHLGREKLQIQIICRQQLSKYTADIDEEFLKKSKNLQFFFSNVAELYHYLISYFSNLSITKNGALQFNLELNLGQLLKTFECKIETDKQEIREDQLFDLELYNLSTQIRQRKTQNTCIQAGLYSHVKHLKEMKTQIEKCQKVLNNKDEIVNTILHEIQEIKRWRTQWQKKVQQKQLQEHKFISDESNPHHKKFVQLGSRVKKVMGGSWDVLINKMAISKTEITKYIIRQIRAGSNGSFMYGIATADVKGINRAQDSCSFIGYYQLTGNVYEQGVSRKGGPKIKDGDTITIIVDPKKWKVYWYIQGKKEVDAIIPGQLRGCQLYLTLVVFNTDAEVNFL